ncbi:acyltransferase domain-containing protein [Plectonema radiosum NIES-515]|uniref:Acyltransferase domain-containing protein n=1 Tax=Plectonema radiosum NIES-515 TaxID=2986073 RepID=A0ABT3B5L5_9CYAN|nr:type I polyketide synthase [Plectonema radiosum]MCV3216666.1 acyltransferase domain-containing protein [Plectonema radiosum NIES-515]
MNTDNNSQIIDGDAIAIIGMAGRFPGAKNVNIFWQNLRDGVESITFFNDEELLSAGIKPKSLNDPNYVKAFGVLEDIELFDANFFGFTPKEAEIIDPQHRLFIECVWEALENAGYNSTIYPGQIGLFAGAALSSYLLHNLFSQFYPHWDMLKPVESFQMFIGNDKDHLPTQISYKLNLKGPSVNVQTACSTSLVAVHFACQSLLNGESDMALAGGVSIHLPQTAGYYYEQGGILSNDGHCRAFDADASGTIFGNGLGVVVLKRLEDAVRDRNYIHAVIKGSAINNDGSLKVGYTAPSVDGQTAVILEALALADVEPETISYIETHGTGTVLGDPIEIAGLTQAFRNSTDKKGFCAIASAKTNVGHLNTAAGVTGLIKTVQALKHQQIPPNLHFQTPNPQIDFANSPFYVNTKLSEWKTNGEPRRAGVSSFGIGGTNAHVILEEAPIFRQGAGETNPRLGGLRHVRVASRRELGGLANPKGGRELGRDYQLLCLSAKSEQALEQIKINLATHLQQHPELNLADVTYTLCIGRQAFDYRQMVVCRDIEDAIKVLANLDTQRIFTFYQKPSKRPVIFMFSGQGSQYVNMARELYEVEPIFQEQVDICADILKPHLGLDIRQTIYPSEQEIQTASAQLQQTAIAQPALFTIEYALAKLWMSWGVLPTAMIGHSIGEYVAATLAGVFTLKDALALVAARGQMMQQQPSGSMLAVALPEAEVKQFLGQELSLAAVNSPSACVVSGKTEIIETLQNYLANKNINCRLLYTSHAFHSQMMEPILADFTEEVKKANPQIPKIPFISNLTGTWIQANEATNTHYWSQHLRSCVRFSEGISELLKQSEGIFLEVGAGRTLSTLTRQHLTTNSKQLILTSLRHPQEQQTDIAFILNALGQLWLAGIDIDWSEFYSHIQPYRVPLPTYPFERQRYWIEAKMPSLVSQEENKVFSQSATLTETKVQESNISYSRPNISNSYIAPTNELEEQIAKVWQEVLGIQQVGIYDNFFELGGDSLIATQLASRLQANFPVELALRELLLQALTVAKQAEMIEELLLEKIAELSEEEVQTILTT